MSQSSNAVRRLELVGGKSAAKLPQYMHRRGDMLYFKRKIPADAADAFPAFKEQVWKALGTNLLAKAKVRLAVEVTEFNLTLAAFRRNKAAQERDQEREPAPPGLALVGGRSAEAQTQGLLEAVRPADASATVEIAALALPAASPSTEPRPLGQAVVGQEAQLEADRLKLLRSLEVGLEQLRQMTQGAESAVPASPARSRAEQKLQHSPLATAVAPRVVGPTQTLMHLLEDWKQTQTRPRTISAYQTAVMEFRKLHGTIPVEAITRPMVRAYRDHLIEQGLSKGTIENRIGFLSTLIRHGMTELVEHLAGNPFERIGVVGASGLKPKKDRRAYEVWELNLLYASELYTQGYRPEGQSIDAAYWLPLMGPFVGGRIEELCQLAISDVQSINGVWCLRICNLDEDQKLKNEGSFRRVPLHDELIKCGFLAYAAKVAAAGHRRLFPTLSNRNANEIYSNSPGKWWGRYCDRIGLTDHRLDYHSFRYLMKQRLGLCGVENEPRDALLGHWASDSNAKRVYMRAEENQYPFPSLVAAMKKLRYDELRIEHLYVAQPYEGVGEHLVR